MELPLGGLITGGGAAPPPPLSKNMETSISNQSCGTAAETPKINSNDNSNDNSQPTNIMNPANDESVTLKKNADEYQCAVCSLKNNIKSGKLAATQENKKAPYMARPSDVEAFLRATPGIVSVFHPAGKKPAATEAMNPPRANKPDYEPSDTATISPMRSVTASEGHGNQPSVVVESREGQACQNQETFVAHLDSPKAQFGSSKRRRRRRGKGDGATPSIASSTQPPVLKALAGTTPQERLRITACLTELLCLVASA